MILGLEAAEPAAGSTTSTLASVAGLAINVLVTAKVNRKTHPVIFWAFGPLGLAVSAYRLAKKAGQ